MRYDDDYTHDCGLLTLRLLIGFIPDEICDLVNLTVLKLSNNCFKGSIPKQIGLLTSLKHLSLDRNKLTGEYMHIYIH